MTDLASPTDLRHFLGINHSNLDMGRAKRLLSQASELIRGYCKQEITQVTGDTATLTGRGEPELLVPEQPVVSVASITEDGVAVPASDFDCSSAGVLRRLFGVWGLESDPSVIVVTYTHGYSPVPQDVRAVCLAVAGRAYTFREPGRDSIALDGLQEARGFSPDMVLTLQEQRSLTPYAVVR